MQLTGGETRRLLTFVADATALDGPRAFTTELVDHLTATSGCEFATYYTFDPTTGDPTTGESHHDYVPCSREVPMPEEGWGGIPAVADLHRHDVQFWSDTLPKNVRWRYESAPFAKAGELVDCAWTIIPVAPGVSASSTSTGRSATSQHVTAGSSRRSGRTWWR